jgi:hypothetical protein
MYSVVKELRWARRMTSATGRKQPRTTPHDYRCAVQRGSIYHRGVQAPPVRRADVELPKLPLKGCGPPRALVCGSRHAARSLMAIYCDLPMAMTLSSTRATCARNGARPSTATTHARMLDDPVSADSAATWTTSWHAGGTSSGSRVRTILRGSWASSRAVATMRTAGAPTGARSRTQATRR